MGARAFMFPRLNQMFGGDPFVGYIGRPERASPGEGYPAAHAGRAEPDHHHRAGPLDRAHAQPDQVAGRALAAQRVAHDRRARRDVRLQAVEQLRPARVDLDRAAHARPARSPCRPAWAAASPAQKSSSSFSGRQLARALVERRRLVGARPSPDERVRRARRAGRRDGGRPGARARASGSGWSSTRSSVTRCHGSPSGATTRIAADWRPRTSPPSASAASRASDQPVGRASPAPRGRPPPSRATPRAGPSCSPGRRSPRRSRGRRARCSARRCARRCAPGRPPPPPGARTPRRPRRARRASASGAETPSRMSASARGP